MLRGPRQEAVCTAGGAGGGEDARSAMPVERKSAGGQSPGERHLSVRREIAGGGGGGGVSSCWEKRGAGGRMNFVSHA